MAATGTVTVTIPYRPRAAFSALHTRTQRWAAVVAHRRAGKTVACVNELIRAALLNGREYPPPRYGYLAPTYTQAKDVAWNYLKFYTAGLPGIDARESDLQVKLPTGGMIRLYGADNYDRMRGLYFDGVVVDEPADISPAAWPEVVRPALADHAGWAVFIGTPRGKNHFYRIVERLDEDDKPLGDRDEWLKLIIPSSTSGILPEAELADAKRSMSREQFAQEFECSFDAAIQGAFYVEELQRARADKRIGIVPIDRVLPVHTGWDLGYTDPSAIWFVQVSGREIRLVDYHEESGMSIPESVKVLDRKREEHGWRYADGSNGAEHWFPHDVEDHELGTGQSRRQTFEAAGVRVHTVPLAAIGDGINATRRLLERTWIDEVRCRRGLAALAAYRRDWDEKNRIFRPKPLHDWASHGADALRTFAMGFGDDSAPKEKRAYKRHKKSTGASAWSA